MIKLNNFETRCKSHVETVRNNKITNNKANTSNNSIEKKR